MHDTYDYIIVGSGFYGAVIAERIASDLNKKVLVLEKNYHIGGNCYSEVHAETGIEYHKYGTHIFHTSNPRVYNFIKRFCDFNGYYHQVLTTFKDKVFQMPINLETINSFFNVNLKPFEVESFLKQKIEAAAIGEPKNFEEAALKSIGKELYEAFIKGYTQKQWEKDPKELPASIIKRLPVRKNYNESYFFDTWQGIPINGYTDIFTKMLNHKNITVQLNTDFFDVRNEIPENTKVVYTGPIDKYFDYCFGRLEWRSLRFEQEVENVDDYQGTSVMNYAEAEVPFTRIHEPKHLHVEREVFTFPKTLLIKEYSLENNDDPYYPISDEANKAILAKYQDKAAGFKDLIIGGRLGDYKYYDMHHTIEKALLTYSHKIGNEKN
jgi:UDP-galactopyranose mutase